MKGVLDLTTAPLLSLEDVGTLCRSISLAQRALRAGWIKPCARTSERGLGKYLFTRQNVDSFLARIADGEVPTEEDCRPRIPRNGR